MVGMGIAMHADEGIIDRGTWPVAILPAAVALAVLPGSHDGTADVKTLVIALCVSAVCLHALWHGWWAARRPLGPAARLVAGAFLVTAVIATVTSDSPALSVMGVAQRHNGLLAYALGIGLLGLVACAASEKRLGQAARSLAGGAVLAVFYWLCQTAGWDPLGIMPPEGSYAGSRVFSSTLDNPNFSGAFVAAALPCALWAGIASTGRGRRVAWMTAAALLAVAAVGSDSLQAVIAATTGVGALGLAMVARNRRAYLAALAAGAVLVCLAGVGLAQQGPFAQLGREETLVSRTWDWTAAARMAADQPLTGVGLARFTGYVRAYRPPGDIVNYGWAVQADAAHSVPLDLLAGGGVPLLAAYLALVGLVGVRLVQGLSRLEGDRLLLLAAFGGVWTAYQTQSLVSIDMSQLWMLHFLSAGAILALTSRAPLEASPAAPERVRPPMRVAVHGLLLATVTVLLCTCAAEWWVGQAQTRDAPTRVAAARMAVRLVPWQPMYWAVLGSAYASAGDEDRALDALLVGTRRDPRDLYQLVPAAQLARGLGQAELAHQLMHAALLVEPQAAEVKVWAAETALALGRKAEARRLLDAALAFDPANQEARRMRAGLPVAQGS